MDGKTLFVKKAQSLDRINLTEKDDSLITNCEEVSRELNNLFPRAVKNLNNPDIGHCKY